MEGKKEKAPAYGTILESGQFARECFDLKESCSISAGVNQSGTFHFDIGLTIYYDHDSQYCEAIDLYVGQYPDKEHMNLIESAIVELPIKSAIKIAKKILEFCKKNI